ncbi:hypothetical protein AWZ03_011693 [Drosophila navojoa]|uniref:Uncharacterized protein n=1 Tax=Drosophila navojoa TaxID=7232 RepID=A0A484AZ64_DRONA|nr:hypothetical protein AWZ03_011693 [Drosophila navojoa]
MCAPHTKKAEHKCSPLLPRTPAVARRCPGPMTQRGNGGGAALPACLSTDLASMTNHDDFSSNSNSDSDSDSSVDYKCCGFTF